MSTVVLNDRTELYAVSSVTDEKPTDRFDEIVYTGASKCLIDPKEEKR